MLDWLIRGAQVLDGTGADAFPADVGIKDGTIAAVGRLTDADAAHVLDAQGRTLTPGFLDIHRHTDAALFRPEYGKAELAQGLTTLVGGNCGMSLAPLAGAHAPAVRAYLAPITGAFGDELCFASLADYFAAAERTPQLVNNAMLAGMGTLRALVAGFDDAPLTDGQYRELHRLVERSLADGAVGVSLGLGYAPECFYTTDGLIRALEPLRSGRLPITVHMRQEGDGVVDALREMLTVARELRCPWRSRTSRASGGGIGATPCRKCCGSLKTPARRGWTSPATCIPIPPARPSSFTFCRRNFRRAGWMR